MSTAILIINFLVAVEKVTDHDPTAFSTNTPRERMWRIRARYVVLATGAFERPLVFHNNDKPGVMIASAVSAYINRYSVRPGKKFVFFTNNDSAYRAVLDCYDAGLDVAAVVDSRNNSDGDLANRAREKSIRIFYQHVITDVKGSSRVEGVSIAALDSQMQIISGTTKDLDCNTLVVSGGGWSPAVHLFAQSGGKAKWDNELSCFVPGESMQKKQQSCGSANGTFGLNQCIVEGFEAGVKAAAETGFDAQLPQMPQVADESHAAIQPLWLVPSPHEDRKGPKQFVDYQNDTSASDIKLAIQEGYRSIEHIKRYTALGFGTDQGKLGNINGMAIAAQTLGQSIPETGTTTFRPAYTPVTFGAIAGPELGDLFDPIRKTSIHPWHVEHGAEFENVGQWKRPWYYPHDGEDIHTAVNRECKATRDSVGIMDASTLGKIDIKGPDAAEFFESHVYQCLEKTGHWPLPIRPDAGRGTAWSWMMV